MAQLRLATGGKQTGSVTMTTETTTVTEAITEIDITKSILLVTYRGAVAAPNTSAFRWYFSSLSGNLSDQITFERNADDATNANVDFEWQVLTFATGLTAQHFQVSDVDDNETQAISAVDLGTSFIIGMGCAKGGTGFSADDMVQLRFASTTSVEFVFVSGATPTDFSVSFTVVDIDEAEVQFSDHGIAASTVTSFTETFSNFTSTSHALVFSTCSTTASAEFFDDLLWTCQVATDETVDFKRGNGISVTFDFSTFLVNFAAEDVLTEHGYEALASGTDTDVDVPLGLSFSDTALMAVYAGGCANGWPHPNGTLNQANWNNYFCALTVVDAGNINIRRDSGASNDSNLAWWVAEFTEESGGAPVDGSFSGAGAGSGVIAVAGLKLRAPITGAGAGSGVASAKIRPATISAAGAGSGTVSAKLKPNGVSASGAGAGTIAVSGIKLRAGISGGGAGAGAASGIKLRVTVSGAGAGSGVVNAAIAGLVEFLVEEVESLLASFLTMEEYMSVLGIWNGALARLGQSPVTSAPASDGTATGDLLAANWSEFKEQFLRKTAWDGGKRTALLVTFKNDDGVTPVAPVSPERWSFCYALPEDHVRSLRMNGRENQPGPKSLGGLGLWEEETAVNDVGELRRCLFADDEPAYLEYIFLVPDSHITLLPADMRRAMAKEFAVEIAPFFGKTESDLISLEAHAAKAVSEAKRSDDQTGSKPTFIDRSMEQAFW